MPSASDKMRSWPGRYELRLYVPPHDGRVKWFPCEAVHLETARGGLRIRRPPNPRTSFVEIHEVRGADAVGRERLRIARAKIILMLEAEIEP